MDRDLQTILLRDNRWIGDREQLGSWLASAVPSPFVPRALSAPCLDRWRAARRAHLVVGPRQAGKSSLLRAHLATLGQPALVIDCQEALIQQWCRSAALFASSLTELTHALPILMFDEIQHLEDAGLFLKGLVDRDLDIPILVTGSSSFHLRARRRESLAGRATRTRLLPFSFAEVCYGIDQLAPALADTARQERFARHLIVGGYPEIWLSENPRPLLLELVEAFVLRDASDLFKVARPDAFRRLLRLLAHQTGSLVNLAEWASILGIARDTVGAYLDILEETHVVATLRPFVGGKRSELTSRPKVFMIDNGIRNHLLGSFESPQRRADEGALMENWVFTELHKSIPQDATLHFWRSTSGAEVDFVVVRGARCVAVEVKATALRRPIVKRGLRSFLEAYRPEMTVVVNTGLEHISQIDGSPIRWLRPFDFARAVQDVLGV